MKNLTSIFALLFLFIACFSDCKRKGFLEVGQINMRTAFRYCAACHTPYLDTTAPSLRSLCEDGNFESTLVKLDTTIKNGFLLEDNIHHRIELSEKELRSIAAYICELYNSSGSVRIWVVGKD